MLILTIRTDKPEAEIGLFEDQTKLAYQTWQAHRELSSTILTKVEAVLKTKNKTLQDLGGIVGFRGPGSFTGLRIGLTVANTLAYGLGIPIVGASGDDWLNGGINKLKNREDDQIILPEYGAPVHITQPRH